MKVTYSLALATALAFGCSSGSKSTRTTAAGNDTGTTQPGSISGTQGTAAGANGAQGTTATAGTSTTPNSGAVSQGQVDTNTQGSMSTQQQGSTASSQQGTASGAASAQSNTQQQPGNTVGGVSGTSGNPSYGQPNTGTSSGSSSTAAQGSVSGSTSPSSSSGSVDRRSGAMGGTVAGSSDMSNLRTVTGSVSKVDENSITLDQAAGGVTLTVDSQTQVIRRGKPAAGISSIREGEQVRASFDPASNRAEKIEVMGKAKMNKHSKAMAPDSQQNPDQAPAPATK